MAAFAEGGSGSTTAPPMFAATQSFAAAVRPAMITRPRWPQSSPAVAGVCSYVCLTPMWPARMRYPCYVCLTPRSFVLPTSTTYQVELMNGVPEAKFPLLLKKIVAHQLAQATNAKSRGAAVFSEDEEVKLCEVLGGDLEPRDLRTVVRGCAYVLARAGRGPRY